MSRKKKETRIIVTMALAAVLLLATTAYSAANNITGYEKLKDSIFNLAKCQNYTAEYKLVLSYDGVNIQTDSTLAKYEDNKNRSQTKSFNTSSGWFDTGETYYQDGLYIMQGVDRYYAFRSQRDSFLSDNQHKLMNTVFDTLLGDTKNYFYNNDGNIELNIERNQIPELAQLFVSVAFEATNGIADNSNDNDSGSAENESSRYEPTAANQANILAGGITIFGGGTPIPTGDITIDKVTCNAKLNGKSEFEALVFYVSLIENVSNGVSHLYEFNFDAKIYDVGSTVADKLDYRSVNIEFYN